METVGHEDDPPLCLGLAQAELLEHLKDCGDAIFARKHDFCAAILVLES